MLYVVHLGVMLLVGRQVMGFTLPEVLVASNANVVGRLVLFHLWFYRRTKRSAPRLRCAQSQLTSPEQAND